MLTIIFHDMSEGVLSVSRFFSVFFFFISGSRRFVRFHTKLVDILTIVI